jgi:O-antigen/teichoic acid export membrane protein
MDCAMSERSATTIAANTGSIVTAQIVNKAASVLFLLFVARHFGTYGFGEYAFAFGILSILLLFTDFGLGMLSVRELARDRDRADRVFTANVVARLLLAVAAVVLLQAVMPWLRLTPAIREMLNILQLLLVFQAFTGSYGVVFNAFEVMRYPQLLTVIQTVSVAVLGITFLTLGMNVTGLAYLAAAIGLANVALAAILMRWKVRRLHWRPDRGLVARLLRGAWPFALTSLFAIVYFRIGIFFLQYLSGPAAVGSFMAAFKILEAYLILPGALSVALFPHLSRSAMEPGRALPAAIEKAFRYLLVIGIPVAVATIGFADRIVIALFSDSYADSAAVLRVLGIGVVPLFLNAVLGSAALSLNRERTTMAIAAAMVGFNAVLHALLIPAGGLVGAAWATVISQGLVCGLYLILLSRWVPGLALLRPVGKPLAAGCAFLPLLWTGPAAAPVLVSTLFYAGLLLVLRAVEHGDVVLFRKILNLSEGSS